MRRRTLALLVIATVATFVLALQIGSRHGDFGGSDAAAAEEVAAVDPGYEPWFEPFWTQPGGEVESGLFALQAALGAGLLGFALGSLRERRRAPRPARPQAD